MCLVITIRGKTDLLLTSDLPLPLKVRRWGFESGSTRRGTGAGASCVEGDYPFRPGPTGRVVGSRVCTIMSADTKDREE